MNDSFEFDPRDKGRLSSDRRAGLVDEIRGSNRLAQEALQKVVPKETRSPVQTEEQHAFDEPSIQKLGLNGADRELLTQAERDEFNREVDAIFEADEREAAKQGLPPHNTGVSSIDNDLTQTLEKAAGKKDPSVGLKWGTGDADEVEKKLVDAEHELSEKTLSEIPTSNEGTPQDFHAAELIALKKIESESQERRRELMATGTSVQIKRTSGDIQEGKFVGIADGGARVYFVDTDKSIRFKDIPLNDLIALNPHLTYKTKISHPKIKGGDTLNAKHEATMDAWYGFELPEKESSIRLDTITIGKKVSVMTDNRRELAIVRRVEDDQVLVEYEDGIFEFVSRKLLGDPSLAQKQTRTAPGRGIQEKSPNTTNDSYTVWQHGYEDPDQEAIKNRKQIPQQRKLSGPTTHMYTSQKVQNVGFMPPVLPKKKEDILLEETKTGKLLLEEIPYTISLGKKYRKIDKTGLDMSDYVEVPQKIISPDEISTPNIATPDIIDSMNEKPHYLFKDGKLVLAQEVLPEPAPLPPTNELEPRSLPAYLEDALMQESRGEPTDPETRAKLIEYGYEDELTKIPAVQSIIGTEKETPTTSPDNSEENLPKNTEGGVVVPDHIKQYPETKLRKMILLRKGILKDIEKGGKKPRLDEVSTLEKEIKALEKIIESKQADRSTVDAIKNIETVPELSTASEVSNIELSPSGSLGRDGQGVSAQEFQAELDKEFKKRAPYNVGSITYNGIDITNLGQNISFPKVPQKEQTEEKSIPASSTNDATPTEGVIDWAGQVQADFDKDTIEVEKDRSAPKKDSMSKLAEALRRAEIEGVPTPATPATPARDFNAEQLAINANIQAYEVAIETSKKSIDSLLKTEKSITDTLNTEQLLSDKDKEETLRIVREKRIALEATVKKVESELEELRKQKVALDTQASQQNISTPPPVPNQNVAPAQPSAPNISFIENLSVFERKIKDQKSLSDLCKLLISEGYKDRAFGLGTRGKFNGKQITGSEIAKRISEKILSAEPKAQIDPYLFIPDEFIARKVHELLQEEGGWTEGVSQYGLVIFERKENVARSADVQKGIDETIASVKKVTNPGVLRRMYNWARNNKKKTAATAIGGAAAPYILPRLFAMLLGIGSDQAAPAQNTQGDPSSRERVEDVRGGGNIASTAANASVQTLDAASATPKVRMRKVTLEGPNGEKYTVEIPETGSPSATPEAQPQATAETGAQSGQGSETEQPENPQQEQGSDAVGGTSSTTAPGDALPDLTRERFNADSGSGSIPNLTKETFSAEPTNQAENLAAQTFLQSKDGYENRFHEAGTLASFARVQNLGLGANPVFPPEKTFNGTVSPKNYAWNFLLRQPLLKIIPNKAQDRNRNLTEEYRKFVVTEHGSDNVIDTREGLNDNVLGGSGARLERFDAFYKNIANLANILPTRPGFTNEDRARLANTNLTVGEYLALIDTLTQKYNIGNTGFGELSSNEYTAINSFVPTKVAPQQNERSSQTLTEAAPSNDSQTLEAPTDRVRYVDSYMQGIDFSRARNEVELQDIFNSQVQGVITTFQNEDRQLRAEQNAYTEDELRYIGKQFITLRDRIQNETGNTNRVSQLNGVIRDIATRVRGFESNE